MAVHWRVGDPTPCGVIAGMSRCTKDEGKPNGRLCMSGADLNRRTDREGIARKPAFQPYWGKPAVRNDRGIKETSASFEARSAP